MSVERLNKIVYIVVPVYNVEKYLSKCVDSILSQTYHEIEIILVDDGSTDNSGQICDAYVRRQKNIVCIHQRNSGLARARNTGIEYAIQHSGSNIEDALIAFIDSDDYIHPKMISSLMEMLRVTEQVAVAGIDAVTVLENEPVMFSEVDLSYFETIDYLKFAYRYLTHVVSVSVCNKIFKLSLFREIRFAEGRLNEDGLLLYELLLKNRCTYIHLPVPMYFYLLREGSITRSGFGKHIIDMIGNFKRIENLTMEYAPSLQKEANDNYLYGCATFCAVLPLSYYLRNRRGIPKIVEEEIITRKDTIGNSNLKRRDKIILRLYAKAPLLAVTIFSIYRRIKKELKKQNLPQI